MSLQQDFADALLKTVMMRGKESGDRKETKMQLDWRQILTHLGRLMVDWEQRA